MDPPSFAGCRHASSHHPAAALGAAPLTSHPASRHHAQVRAMEILTRHCMGDAPVQFQVLSDQVANFTTG